MQVEVATSTRGVASPLPTSLPGVYFPTEIGIGKPDALLLEVLPGGSQRLLPMSCRHFPNLPKSPGIVQLQQVSIANG